MSGFWCGPVTKSTRRCLCWMDIVTLCHTQVTWYGHHPSLMWCMTQTIHNEPTKTIFATNLYYSNNIFQLQHHSGVEWRVKLSAIVTQSVLDECNLKIYLTMLNVPSCFIKTYVNNNAQNTYWLILMIDWLTLLKIKTRVQSVFWHNVEK